jgi:hypothetical protein
MMTTSIVLMRIAWRPLAVKLPHRRKRRDANRLVQAMSTIPLARAQKYRAKAFSH